MKTRPTRPLGAGVPLLVPRLFLVGLDLVLKQKLLFSGSICCLMISISELLNHELEEKMSSQNPSEAAPSINVQGSYEFSNTENATIFDLVGKMRFVGMFLIIAGLLACVTVVQGHYGGLVSGLINIVIGFYTRSAAERFAKIVKTEGDDIRHLMDALGELLKIYRLQMILILVAIVLMVVAVAFVFVQGM